MFEVDARRPPGYSPHVPRFYYREFLERFDDKGRLSCVCGQEHRLTTKSVLTDPGSLTTSARLVSERHGKAVRLWVLSDENTEAAAGARWKAELRVGKVVSRVLPGAPRPVPSIEFASSLLAEARRAAPDLLVAVGGGVISDLVKRASLEGGIPNWCIATAPSVDAYSSATSALRVNGFHGTASARTSEMIVCDPEVMSHAPKEMFLAGLGDLLAKFHAAIDWGLSRIITGEHFCPLLAEMALGSARSALAAARGLATDPTESLRTLTDAVLSSGFAMQAAGGSRCAASAEHTIAHFWETIHAAQTKRLDLHGMLAASASRIMLPIYQALYRRLATYQPDGAARLADFDREPSWESSMEEGMRPYRAKVHEEMKDYRLTRDMLSDRLARFTSQRKAILDLANPLLSELEAAARAARGDALSILSWRAGNLQGSRPSPPAQRAAPEKPLHGVRSGLRAGSLGLHARTDGGGGRGDGLIPGHRDGPIPGRGHSSAALRAGN